MRKHLLLVITLLCAVVQGLWAQTSTVSYIWYSADSETHELTKNTSTCTGNNLTSATNVTNSTFTNEGGWWVVKDEVTHTGRINVEKDTWIVLCDHANLSAGKGIYIKKDVTLTIAGSPLDGATVKELLTTSNLNNGKLTLNFSGNLTAIDAGKPYIVKWGTTGTDISNPVFEDVTITSTAPTAVEFTGGSFVGQYDPFAIDASNIDEIILLAAGNKLGYSQNPRTLHPFRCHFDIPTTAGARTVNDYVLDFGDDETTRIISTTDYTDSAGWFTLDGRKLTGEPTQKGIYIHDGRKTVIK